MAPEPNGIWPPSVTSVRAGAASPRRTRRAPRITATSLQIFTTHVLPRSTTHGLPLSQPEPTLDTVAAARFALPWAATPAQTVHSQRGKALTMQRKPQIFLGNSFLCVAPSLRAIQPRAQGNGVKASPRKAKPHRAAGSTGRRAEHQVFNQSTKPCSQGSPQRWGKQKSSSTPSGSPRACSKQHCCSPCPQIAEARFLSHLALLGHGKFHTRGPQHTAQPHGR